jgi:hypothetical protein
VLALFATIVANRGANQNGTTERSTLIKMFEPASTDQPAATATPDAVVGELRSTPGVLSAAVFHEIPAAARGEDPSHIPAEPVRRQGASGLVSCADLAKTPAFGRCEAGAAVAEVWFESISDDESEAQGTVWTTAPLSAADLKQLPLLSIVVTTDGSTSATEQARTILELAYPDEWQPPYADGDFESDFTQSLTGWKQLANVAIIAGLVIAGCSLAVSIVSGLNERKRPFTLLRLSGVQLRVLRRVVALESAVPLMIVATVAIGAGFLAAQLFLEAQMEYTLQPPGRDYYLMVIVGLVAALSIIASTLPLLARTTAPETARFE